MRKFVVRAVSFTMLIYVVMSALDFKLSDMASKSNYRAIEAWTEWMGGNVDADCIIMGNSRAEDHVSPVVLDSVAGTVSYNLGIAGAHFDLCNSVYYIYRKRNRIPSLVLINVDYASVFPTRPESNRFQYYPWFHDKEFRKAFFSVIHPSLAERFIPIYRFSPIDSRIFQRWPKTSERGFLGHSMSFSAERVQNNTLFFHVDEAVESSFVELIDTLRADGADVVLFVSPIHADTFRRMPNYEEMMAYYDSISFIKGIPLLNYTDMWLCEDEAFFMDGLHLNRTGALVFTDSLAQDIIRLGLSR